MQSAPTCTSLPFHPHSNSKTSACSKISEDDGSEAVDFSLSLLKKLLMPTTPCFAEMHDEERGSFLRVGLENEHASRRHEEPRSTLNASKTSWLHGDVVRVVAILSTAACVGLALLVMVGKVHCGFGSSSFSRLASSPPVAPAAATVLFTAPVVSESSAKAGTLSVDDVISTMRNFFQWFFLSSLPC